MIIGYQLPPPPTIVPTAIAHAWSSFLLALQEQISHLAMQASAAYK